MGGLIGLTGEPSPPKGHEDHCMVRQARLLVRAPQTEARSPFWLEKEEKRAKALT